MDTNRDGAIMVEHHVYRYAVGIVGYGGAAVMRIWGGCIVPMSLVSHDLPDQLRVAQTSCYGPGAVGLG